MGEVDFSADDLRVLRRQRRARCSPTSRSSSLGGDGSAFVRRSSVGVLLGIMPWNYPYYQVARFAGPNLVIGNTILLKHAPQCPESAAAMEEIFHEAAGFPTDAYINIYATNEQIEGVIGDPRVRGVSLTGSERAGAAVAEIAGRNLKKVVLELGGSDPFILLSTDDLDADRRVGRRRAAREHRPGVQRREAVHRGRRALRAVPREVHRRALGGQARRIPNSHDATIGPLSSKLAGDRLEDQVKRAVEQGATLVTGGERDGNFYSSTVLTDITAGQRRLPRGVLRPGGLRSTASARRTRRSSWPTTRRSGSARTSSRPTPTRRCASPTRSRPAWCS